MSEKTGLDLLREPFPEHQISKLPRAFKKESPKGRCKPKREGGDAPDNQDFFCGGWHGLPALHLDYVGHAALTDRLLDADPHWHWEPLALDEQGLPRLDEAGGMWIKLTVCGVSRLGYGDAQGKTGPDAVKERIGDALRNAAMRFGAALELWHKGDLHLDEEEKPDPKKDPAGAVAAADVKPTAGVFEKLDSVSQGTVMGMLSRIVDAYNAGDTKLLYTKYLDSKETLDADEQAALWSKLDKGMKASIREQGEAEKQRQLRAMAGSQA